MRAPNGKMEMIAQETKLQAAVNDLKQLMADVTRAMEKAQEAIARVASNATPGIENSPRPSPIYSNPVARAYPRGHPHL